MSDAYISINTHFEVQSGFAFPSTSFVESGIPIVRMSDLKAGKLRFENTKYVGESWLKLSAPFILKHGDFLLGMSGSLSNYAVVTEDDEPALLNQRVGRLKKKDKNADYEYVCYWLKSSTYAQYADIQGEGAAQKNISSKQIGRFNYRNTSLEKQKKISLILNTIETTIEKTEALIHKYQKIKAGLMHDLFIRGVTADGKLRPPREQAPEVYKETPIGWIPKEWDFVTIGECTGSWAMGPRFSAEEYNEYGNVATLRTTDIDQNGFIEYSTMPIARLKLHGLQNHILKQNDFVITRSGTCGICAVFDDFPLPVLPGAFLIRFRFNDLLSEEYMKNCLNSENGRPLVYRVTEGGVQKNLRGTSLCKIKFPHPTLDEQKRINLQIQAVDKFLTEESNKKAKLIKQKSGLMHDLLTGKVPVKVEQKEIGHV